jgi:hypothetical protein
MSDFKHDFGFFTIDYHLHSYEYGFITRELAFIGKYKKEDCQCVVTFRKDQTCEKFKMQLRTDNDLGWRDTCNSFANIQESLITISIDSSIEFAEYDLKILRQQVEKFIEKIHIRGLVHDGSITKV